MQQSNNKFQNSVTTTVLRITVVSHSNPEKAKSRTLSADTDGCLPLHLFSQAQSWPVHSQLPQELHVPLFLSSEQRSNRSKVPNFHVGSRGIFDTFPLCYVFENHL